MRPAGLGTGGGRRAVVTVLTPATAPAKVFV
jgi:hypothetical protein